ncbi:charged multivesicular body protein 3 [Tribolium castaneum]|uniref:Charged multivesicular body protein 3-like Protein n=1 Tax=Tribolium castaneum TaxID=7070 RepID=D6X057_TRICA|nr:PREDICTED: charged multivesicular body protein 3 [Tribolium castaneum]EFA10075.1 Charged multivesicular body protein 3-like Protein [Tribolium castaneum]|eukprot:XP_968988.1 PREDICTED: charged multivesicular body protein 3 [Tribolium castaneum]
MGLFGKTPERNPKDMVNEWNSKLRKEGYQLDRQIRSIKREEEKVKRSLKEAAKKGDKETCTILAKEILHARQAITRIYTSKAHINSVMLQMKNQLATLRVAGSLAKSTEVMQAMQRLLRVPEVAQTMQNLSKEMMKAGIIEEMLDETMDSFEDTEEMEEAAQTEIDKVLWEITEGKLGEAPAPPVGDKAAAAVEQPESVDVEDEEEIEEMQSRLAALKS